MVDIQKVIRFLTEIEIRDKPKVKSKTARIEFDLGITENIGTNLKKSIYGSYLAKIKYDGSVTGCYFKLDDVRGQKIYPSEFRRSNIDFTNFYLTNAAAQAGKKLIIEVGDVMTGEIEPSTGSKVGLTDSGGADIDPAKEAGNLATLVTDMTELKKRFKKHTFDQIDLTTQTAANTAQAIGGDINVKWLILHNETKAMRLGDSTVTRGGGAHDGQLYAENTYIVLEYVNLSEIFLINSVLGESVIYSGVYVVEAT